MIKNRQNQCKKAKKKVITIWPLNNVKSIFAAWTEIRKMKRKRH